MSTQHHAFFDARMFPDAHLATEYDILLDHDAAGKPGLSGDHYVFPDLAVVPDVHQIIDLGAAADACNLQRSTIDGRVGPDLDVVCNFQVPTWGNFSYAPLARSRT